MEKSARSTYLLILLIGLVFLSSFFELKIGNFDWKYFLILIIYIIVSTVCQFFIVEAFVNKDNTVISSRLIINDVFEQMELKHLWSKYKELSCNNQIVLNFYRAFCLYRFKNSDLAEKRGDSILKKEEFKEAFLKKQLSELIKKEHISIKKRRKIIKLQNVQDDVSYIDKERLDYKRGIYLGKKSSSYYAGLISFVVQFSSLVMAVFSIFNFSIHFDIYLISKLSVIIILLIADFYATWASIRGEIKFWNEYSNEVSSILRVLEGIEEDSIRRSIPYHVYYSKSYE